MAKEVRLLTLLHISDLHIGEIDARTGDAAHSGPIRTLIANTTWFDGILGHHSRGLEHLHRFWKELREEDADAKVIVTGDITRCGGTSELRNAGAFLSSTLALPAGRVGLKAGSWHNHSIPGNHDQWPGIASVFGGPNPVVHSALSAHCPNVTTLRLNGAAVQIASINTDSDVRPYGPSRLFAIGQFQSQLASLSTLLSKAPQYTVRILVLHHSWHKKWLLRIGRASRRALAQFLDQEDIRIVLTGHVHKPLVTPFFPLGKPVAGSPPVYECRSGTTTQVDRVAYDARTIWGGFPVRPRWPANSLLVHRLEQTDTGLKWRVRTYTRLRKGFKDIGPAGAKTLYLR